MNSLKNLNSNIHAQVILIECEFVHNVRLVAHTDLTDHISILPLHLLICLRPFSNKSCRILLELKYTQEFAWLILIVDVYFKLSPGKDMQRFLFSTFSKNLKFIWPRLIFHSYMIYHCIILSLKFRYTLTLNIA